LVPEVPLIARSTPAERTSVPRAPAPPLLFELGAEAYRGSEESWLEAGCPRATVELLVADGELVIGVDVCKSPVVFRAADAPDPMLDNEHPDIHSDGVQLYLSAPSWPVHAAWLAVPEHAGAVRVRCVAGARTDIPLLADWHLTPGGYRMRLATPLDALGELAGAPLGVQVVVNDMSPGRERRRGQLVLSGGVGEFIYLRGDRESLERFRQFLLPSA
jgi:hypothetical protein